MNSRTTKVLKLETFSAVVDSAMNNRVDIDNQQLERIEAHKLSRSKYKIDVNESIPPPQIAWSSINTLNGGHDILGTLGNFSLIIGKAKSRKSFYVNIAISAALQKDVILGRIKSNLPIDKSEVVYFDTEQSKHHVQLAVKRICTQINVPHPTNLHTYYLRSLTPSQRLQFIENEIYSNDNIGFVVIDGIKDLVTSINDEDQATMVASKLLKWTEERNIHIVTVLHQNKGDANARGHIGTELINKAETVLEVAKAEGDSNISIVTPLQCRNIEPEVFAFEINEDGIPVIAEDFQLRTETKRNRFDVTGLEPYKKYKLLTEVFSKGSEFSYKDLSNQLKIDSENQLGKALSNNNISTLITDCKNRSWLLQENLRGKYKLGSFKEEDDKSNTTSLESKEMRNVE